MAKGDFLKKEAVFRINKRLKAMLLPTRSCEFMCGHFLNYQQWEILSLNTTVKLIFHQLEEFI